MEEKNSVIVQNVTKHFKLEGSPKIFGKSTNSKNSNQRGFNALEDVSFEVAKGEMLGIIGLNGSGKTTLLRTIAGIYKPDSGIVKVNGTVAPILNIGTGFHPELNALENITMYGMLLGISKKDIKEKIPSIIEFAELEKFSFEKIKHYSSGMKARLAFSTVLQINPDIILVDEVLAVGDQRFKEKSFIEFSSFKKRGKTILYTTHSLDKVYKLLDRVIILHKGRIVAIGKPEEATKKYEELIKRSND